MTEATVELANRHSTPKRVALAVIGLAVAIWPIWDLWPGIASVSALSPVFWIIGLGALALGLVLFSGAVFGQSTVLLVRPDGLLLQRENLLTGSTLPLRPGDLGALVVVKHDWSEGPATWRVTVSVRGKKPLVSEDFPNRADADALANRLDHALGRIGQIQEF
jgi:hypothetical protein